MQLNQGQQLASDQITRFLHSSDKEFSLSGPGGTGKTTLLKHVIVNVLPEYATSCKLLGIDPVDYSVALTATTNKAVEVLSATTNYPAQTIHSFLNLKVRDNYKTGKSECTKTSAFKVHSRKIIFIDEASMADSTLLKYLHEGTDDTCKIIYLGDHCQMAPVFESISPVYKNPKNFAELTQPMRNAGQPALMQLCAQLRNTVETLEFKPIQPVPGVIEYLDDDQAQKFVEDTFMDLDHSSRILAYTNSAVQEYNWGIRNLRGLPEHLSKGERVVNNTAWASAGGLMRVEEEFVIQDSAPSDSQLLSDGTEIAVYKVSLAKSMTSNYAHEVYQPIYPEFVKELRDYYKSKKDWPMFYELRDLMPDLRQRDASTVYKAQGSTFSSVLIDLSNIGTCKKAEQTARMLYVAASRPSDKIYLYGSLPKRYGGMP